MKSLSRKDFQPSAQARCSPGRRRNADPGRLRCQPETRLTQANSDDWTDALVRITAHRSRLRGMVRCSQPKA
ncbi:protein of unknown function [Cupriavidus taiwanensis]|uniref:Uncharacterized protein n=1 Tax=Cupriavidus taiwanensis TaxID=164546 RepID=A0A375IGP8_9BURK|nr:hypothetical protein CBM2608_A50462 [Cupriavidus taiwanensis]SPA30559.1 hypothetical protein CBM2623_A70045 [Cupriavidus taiwanensis]SPK73250.1 protein of unknown function [Cupriavidus taiwanensis]